MSRINYLLTADGRSVDVSNHNLDSNEFASAVRTYRANSSKVLGVNLYNASNAPFCLGSHVHASAAEARRKASTSNYFSSFEVKYNAGTKSMELVSGNRPDGATYVRFALFNGTVFKKPSYETLHEARYNAGSADIVVEIRVRGTTAVSVRAV